MAAALLTSALEAAMAGMEKAQADFEAAALRVGAELAALRDRVQAANAALSAARREIEAEKRAAKRRRLTGRHEAAATAATDAITLTAYPPPPTLPTPAPPPPPTTHAHTAATAIQLRRVQRVLQRGHRRRARAQACTQA